jgi:small subunit ribosomal protein S17
MEKTTVTRNSRKSKIGKVVSNSMDNSIVVSVERRIRHRIYGKYYRKSSRFMAHDANNECTVGDTVRIMETRPLSKLKRWRLVEILEKAK